MRETLYDREAAVAYAREWAFRRNPIYYDFDDLGGDCTNFISQCVYAGAGVMNYTPIFGWYFRSPEDRTASWTGVEFFYEFITRNLTAGPYAVDAPWSEALPGDVIQLGRADGDFYHTLIITETAPSILVSAHSDDARDRPLESYTYARARLLHIKGVRIF